MTSETQTNAITFGKWMFLRGLIGFIFGLATVFWPRTELGGPTNLGIETRTVTLVILTYLVINGLGLVFQAITLTVPEDTARTIRTVLLGQAIIVIPAGIFLVFSTSTGSVRAAVSTWALLHAGLELWLWYRLRTNSMSSDHLYVAGCHGLLGIIVAAGFGMGALTVFGFTGAGVMIASVLYLLGGYSRFRTIPASTRRL